MFNCNRFRCLCNNWVWIGGTPLMLSITLSLLFSLFLSLFPSLLFPVEFLGVWYNLSSDLSSFLIVTSSCKAVSCLRTSTSWFCVKYDWDSRLNSIVSASGYVGVSISRAADQSSTKDSEILQLQPLPISLQFPTTMTVNLKVNNLKLWIPSKI